MSPSLSASATAPLLFQWESPRRRRAAITLFVIISLLAHAFCFYVFQIIYPAPVALLPPPARVSLITPGSEESRTLLRWMEAEDPALTFATHRPPEARLRALPKIAHLPSYLATEPLLKQAPPLIVDLRMPSAQPPAAVPIEHRSGAVATNALPTTVSFSEELGVVGAPRFPSPKFAATSTEPPQGTRYRVAVGSAGEIRYCFPLNSSGDPALDEQARNYLLLCRFPAIRNPQNASPARTAIRDSLVWGVATIEWGNDVARPAATSTATPSP